MIAGHLVKMVLNAHQLMTQFKYLAQLMALTYLLIRYAGVKRIKDFACERDSFAQCEFVLIYFKCVYSGNTVTAGFSDSDECHLQLSEVCQK